MAEVTEAEGSRRQPLRLWMIAFSVLGLVVSLYLVWIKFSPGSLLCTGVGDCESVNTSIYSSLMGIPVAAFGALTYAMILAALLLETRMSLLSEWGVLIEFGLALVGTLYSAYLTYIELAVLHKICPYCVTSAVAITVILILSGVRLARQWNQS